MARRPAVKVVAPLARRTAHSGRASAAAPRIGLLHVLCRCVEWPRFGVSGTTIGRLSAFDFQRCKTLVWLLMQSSLRAPTYLMTPVFDPLNLSQIERDPVAARVCECVAAGRLVISRVTWCHASSRRTGSLNTVLVSSNNSETTFVTHVFSANYCAEKYCCGSTQYQQQQQQKRRSWRNAR